MFWTNLDCLLLGFNILSCSGVGYLAHFFLFSQRFALNSGMRLPALLFLRFFFWHDAL